MYVNQNYEIVKWFSRFRRTLFCHSHERNQAHQFIEINVRLIYGIENWLTHFRRASFWHSRYRNPTNQAIEMCVKAWLRN